MSRLVTLFQKGFMKLTGGKRITVLWKNEVVLTRDEWEELLFSYGENIKLKKEIKELKEECVERYNKGWINGSSCSLPLACPKPKDKKLTTMISLIATELIEQADVESCEWLYNKIHQCRSL